MPTGIDIRKSVMGPPQLPRAPRQFDVMNWQGWPACVSHMEPHEGGRAPHFVVDWNRTMKGPEQYPFSPSPVPERLSNIWKENAAANKPYVKQGIDDLHDKHWGLPIYVIGTGPSLEKNMDVLRDVEHGIIIATNDAINVLPPDIRVDYYCCVDGELPGRWWENCRKDFTIVSTPLVTPRLVKSFPDNDIRWFRFAGDEGPNECFKDYPELYCLEPGYVVGFTSTHLAFWLGGDPIVWVGMDCCVINGKLHSGDKKAYRCYPMEHYEVAKDIYGIPRVTTPTYLRGCWKLMATAKINSQHRWFVNATEGGILQFKEGNGEDFLTYIDVMPLAEVIAHEKG